MSKTRPKFQTESIIKTWPMVRLGDVCDEIKDRIQSSKISVGEYVTTDNMVKDRGGIVPAEYVPSDVGLVEYHKDDVLIANIRPYLKKIWLADHDGGCSSDVVVFRSNTDGLSSEYLYSVLSQDAYFEYVMQKPRGTKMPRGDRDWMKEFRFPLPSLSVQREIVARLERELAAVEKMKKGFEALAETARAEFKAELNEVFEEISRGGAETRRLGDVCVVISDCPHTTAKDEGAGIPLIRTPNVGFTRLMLAGVHRVSEDVYKQRTKRAVPLPGDLIFAREAPAGNVAVIQEGEKVCLGQRTVLLRLKEGYIPDYIAYSVLQPESQKTLVQKSTGSTVAHVNVCDIKTFLVPLPPLSIQRDVVARLDAAKARAEKLEAKAREGVDVCETMRKAILKEAFESSVKEEAEYG